LLRMSIAASKNYSLTWNLVAALVNLRYACI
jgi:hypothetical protein